MYPLVQIIVMDKLRLFYRIFRELGHGRAFSWLANFVCRNTSISSTSLRSTSHSSWHSLLLFPVRPTVLYALSASTTCTPTTPSSRTCAPRDASSRRPADAAGPTDSRYDYVAPTVVLFTAAYVKFNAHSLTVDARFGRTCCAWLKWSLSGGMQMGPQAPPVIQ